MGSEMRLHAPLDQVDEAELLEVAHLDDAGRLLVGEELQHTGQLEGAYGTAQQHGSGPSPLSRWFSAEYGRNVRMDSDVAGGRREPRARVDLPCEAGYTCPFGHK